MRAARRGIELSPQSSRAYHILFMTLYLRGEIDACLTAAEHAIALNPYDMIVLADYGGRLVCSGEVDRGLALIEETGKPGALRPTWEHYYLFVAYYLKGKRARPGCRCATSNR